MATKVLWLFLNINKYIVEVLGLEEQLVQNHVLLITTESCDKIKGMG